MSSRIASIVAVVFFMLSCSTGKYSTIQIPNMYKSQLSFIPMGNVFVESDTIFLDAFWISKYEVSNKEWKEFINYLKRNGRLDGLKIALPDSAKWAELSSYNLPYANHYHNHSAYLNYPVVNISHEAAILFCQWLTDKINSAAKDHNVAFEIRLPTRLEWIRAAQFGQNRPYAWDSPYLRNEKGAFRANFNFLLNENFTKNPNTKEPLYVLDYENFNRMKGALKDGTAFVTSPVNSYESGVAGLYNMNGNVAEMVREFGIAVGGSWKSFGYDIRNQSTLLYNEPAPYIGFRVIMTAQKMD